MDQRTNPDTNQNIREHLLEGAKHLFLCIGEPFPDRQVRRLDINAASRKHKTFNVLFHMQFLDHGAADNCDNKPKDHIDDRHFCTKNAH